jgi:hypothetical protein
MEYDYDKDGPLMSRRCLFTNADRIRAMTNEELAEFIGHFPMETICPNNCHEDPERDCAVCVLDWLKQEKSE